MTRKEFLTPNEVATLLMVSPVTVPVNVWENAVLVVALPTSTIEPPVRLDESYCVLSR